MLPTMNAITNPSLIGRKIQVRFGDDTLLATLDGLDSAYPATAYRVSWTRADNPHYDAAGLPNANSFCSVLHASYVSCFGEEPTNQ